MGCTPSVCPRFPTKPPAGARLTAMARGVRVSSLPFSTKVTLPKESQNGNVTLDYLSPLNVGFREDTLTVLGPRTVR